MKAQASSGTVCAPLLIYRYIIWRTTQRQAVCSDRWHIDGPSGGLHAYIDEVLSAAPPDVDGFRRILLLLDGACPPSIPCSREHASTSMGYHGACPPSRTAITLQPEAFN